MSDPKKNKQEFYLSVKEAAEKLRTLADELERAVVSINKEEYPIAPDVHAKIRLKAKGGTFSYKLKFKLENHLSEKEDEKAVLSVGSEVENYKDLKKRMSINFSAIKKSCTREHVLPGQDLVEQFFLDAKTMCTYPNKGEEFYTAFLKHAENLYEASKISDVKAMTSAIESLVQARTNCHAKYK